MFAAVHPAADRRFAPWKNGGGETAEIACFPEGAGFDGFGWRISTARVAGDGPFSRFDGVARVLAVLEGGPLALSFADGRRVVLDSESPPFAFDGGLGCDGALLGPPVLDLNVMVRAPFVATVTRGEGVGGSEGLVARFVLAVEDLPALGLARHDLARLVDGADWPAPAAGLIRIAIGQVGGRVRA